MQIHAEILRQLVEGLFAAEERVHLSRLTSTKSPDAAVIAFDDSLGGPSIGRLSCHRTGRYAVEDRDVFRPLQYCAMNFLRDQRPDWRSDAEWHARDVVEMSSAHIEALVKRVGRLARLSLGQALGKVVVKSKVDPLTWEQLAAFNRIYVDAKHAFDHPMDTHLFSVEEAILAYFVSRRLGAKLYPLANLATDMKIFEKECDQTEMQQLSKAEVH